MSQPASSSSPEPGTGLTELEPLVGQWQMVGTHPAFANAVNGRSTFEWLQAGAILVWHFDWERPGPPSAVSVIGRDDGEEALTMLYSDERGVQRIYRVRLASGVWTMSRTSPGFSQRMTGTLSDDGNTIRVDGELMRDGSRWEPDLAITYTRER